MTNNIPKAEVTQVKIGNLEIEGLILPDGSFGVAVPQIANLFSWFQDDQNQAFKKLKRLMGEGFKTTKCKTVFNKNATSYVTLNVFTEIVKKLAKEKKQQDAFDFLMDLAGLSLEQLFSDAFGIKFEKEERQEFLKQRQEGKVVRRTWTDAVKDWITAHEDELTDNDKKFVWVHISDGLNKGLFGRTSKQLKQDWKLKPNQQIRDYMSVQELKYVEDIEDLAMRILDKHRLTIKPTIAIHLALESLIIPVQTR
jgi:hypothetical protein